MSVARILEAFAGLELGLGRGLDGHRLAGARVAPGGGLALGHRESAEPDQAYLVAPLEGSGDRIEHAFDRLRCIAARKTAGIGDGTDQLVLVHPRKTPSFSVLSVRNFDSRRDAGN